RRRGAAERLGLDQRPRQLAGLDVLEGGGHIGPAEGRIGQVRRRRLIAGVRRRGERRQRRVAPILADGGVEILVREGGGAPVGLIGGLGLGRLALHALAGFSQQSGGALLALAHALGQFSRRAVVALLDAFGRLGQALADI